MTYKGHSTMAEERNFRVQFYERVGLREVEERRTLAALLREEPVDRRRLILWCRRCVVPQWFRPIVWRQVLGVATRYTESQEYVLLQQKLMYQDLWRTIHTLRLHLPPAPSPPYLLPCPDLPKTNGVGGNGASNVPQPHHYVFMWLLSESRLINNPQQQLQLRECRQFLAIVRRMKHFFPDPVQILHVSRALRDRLWEQREAIIESVAEATGQIRRENHSLHHHLLSIGFFQGNVMVDLCMGLFYEVLPDAPVAKVIDKVAAGSVGILGCVLLALLLHLRLQLSTVSTDEGVASVLATLKLSEAETVVSIALDSWASKLSHTRRT